MKKAVVLSVLVTFMAIGYAHAYEPEFMQTTQDVRQNLSASAFSAAAQRARPEANKTYPAPIKNIAPTTVGSSGITKTLARGLKNDPQVKFLQEYLVQKGYLSTTPDGNFGPLTETAVKKFQTANGVSPLGIVGPQTRTLIK